MKESRVKASLHNITFGIGGQIFNYILIFATKTIFIHLLGILYLGVSGLFSSILSMIALAELGIGSAITFSLYKPLAENDIKSIKALMQLYRKVYNIIGLVVLILGISLTPFLGSLIKDQPTIPDFSLIYVLYVVNSASSYLFSYKRSIINADQKGYINTINLSIFSLLCNIAQIVVLLLTHNFILYLITQIIVIFLSNVAISNKANRLYPYLKDKTVEKLDPNKKKDITKKIYAMAFHNIGSVVVLGTDNLLISSFVGIIAVGLYSNYLMLLSFVQSFVSQIVNVLTASVGNFVALQSKEKSLDFFYKLYFFNFYIFGFCSSCLFTLIDPFITLWIGEEYLLPSEVSALIIISFYIAGMRRVSIIYRNATGMFYYDRYRPLFEAIINLVASIWLLKTIGLPGVFLGTIISSLTTCFWVEPYVLYKYLFHTSARLYFKRYLLYSAATIAVTLGVHSSVYRIPHDTWVGFIIMALACCIMTMFLIILLFFRTEEFKYFWILAKNILNGSKCKFLKKEKFIQPQRKDIN